MDGTRDYHTKSVQKEKDEGDREDGRGVRREDPQLLHKYIKNKSALTIITKYQIKAGTTKSFKEDPQCNQVE